MNPKIEKLERNIEKTETKIAELKQKLSNLKAQKTELENAEFVSACRRYHLTPAELHEFLQSKQLPSGTDETEGDHED